MMGANNTRLFVWMSLFAMMWLARRGLQVQEDKIEREHSEPHVLYEE
jgi:hypothetical protein